MEKIQMTEEQAMCLYRMAGDGHVEFIKRLKQAGYIRKSALEIVEEEYLNHKSGKEEVMTGYDKIKKFVSEVHEINCALTDEIIEFIDEVILQEQVGNVEFIKRLKQAGHIRKSAVEEAEEMYIRRAGVVDTLHITQQAAIQELKSEIERLKK